jgi:hypothetical protein
MRLFAESGSLTFCPGGGTQTRGRLDISVKRRIMAEKAP